MGLGKKTLTLCLFVAAQFFGITLFAANTQSNIETRSGWQSCSECAGKNGHGVTTPHSMTRFIRTPSMSGHASQFWIGGTHAYGDALWWKQLGGNSGVHHFVYDLYFYLKNPGAPQGLEFDVNQTTGGKMFIFGTECDIKGHHQWRVWQNSSGWRDTGVGCSAPASYQWHHLTEEFYRTSNGQVQFVSITLDGKKHYINQTYAPKKQGGSQISVAFQMDGNKTQTDYSVWLEQISLKYW